MVSQQLGILGDFMLCVNLHDYASVRYTTKKVVLKCISNRAIHIIRFPVRYVMPSSWGNTSASGRCLRLTDTIPLHAASWNWSNRPLPTHACQSYPKSLTTGSFPSPARVSDLLLGIIERIVKSHTLGTLTG
jgi:hypothetical protein